MSQDIGIEDLDGFLKGIVGVTKKPAAEGAMQQIVDLTKTNLNAGFDSGTAPDGSKWPPLKHPRPPHRNQNNKPLIDSEKLKNSVVGQTQDHLEAVSDEGLVLGTFVEYAMFHQNGTSNIPQREFMGFSDIVQSEAIEITADTVIQTINNL